MITLARKILIMKHIIILNIFEYLILIFNIEFFYNNILYYFIIVTHKRVVQFNILKIRVVCLILFRPNMKEYTRIDFHRDSHFSAYVCIPLTRGQRGGKEM